MGQRLYVKLSEVVQNELDSIQEEECMDYAYNSVKAGKKKKIYNIEVIDEIKEEIDRLQKRA